jgi:hypothetical protein
MTTQPENKDKAEQKVSKDELSEKELEKATGGEIKDFSFGVEQTVNIGSGSTGVGAGSTTKK